MKERVEVGMGVQAAFSEGRRLEALATEGQVRAGLKKERKEAFKLNVQMLPRRHLEAGGKRSCRRMKRSMDQILQATVAGIPSC